MAKQGWCSAGLCLCGQQGSPPSQDPGRCHRQVAPRELTRAAPGNPSARRQSWLTTLPEDWASQTRTAALCRPDANTVSTGHLHGQQQSPSHSCHGAWGREAVFHL